MSWFNVYYRKIKILLFTKKKKTITPKKKQIYHAYCNYSIVPPTKDS
jgi:hypothetical protein